MKSGRDMKSERDNIAREIRDYADSIDEFTSRDDIYAGLLDLSREVRRGDYA
jgi:hypothetical protein